MIKQHARYKSITRRKQTQKGRIRIIIVVIKRTVYKRKANKRTPTMLRIHRTKGPIIEFWIAFLLAKHIDPGRPPPSRISVFWAFNSVIAGLFCLALRGSRLKVCLSYTAFSVGCFIDIFYFCCVFVTITSFFLWHCCIIFEINIEFCLLYMICWDSLWCMK